MINKVIEALHDEKVVSFVKSSFKENYQHFFIGYEKIVDRMLDKSFNLLQKLNKDNINEIVDTLNFEVFGKDDPQFWFNQMYHRYKMEIRPRKDLDKIGKYIKGKTVLDFGCGAGFLSIELSKRGFEIVTSDVLQYRIPDAQHFPFKQITNSNTIPFPTRSIDTTVVKTVLHHINTDQILNTLKELRRITKKNLIIEEDTYNLDRSSQIVKKALKTQGRLNKFLIMSPKRQFSCLLLKDYFTNAVVFGHSEMSFTFTFKTLSQWKSLLAKAKFKVERIIIEGFEKDKLTTNCQAWLICN